MKFLGIIPARYASTRFPAKPLAMLGGKTVIQRVYEQVAGILDDAYVATDDERIEVAVKAFGGKVVMTSVDHKSGTDRCYEACTKIGGDFDVVVNIQGDEPFIQPSQLNAVKACFEDPTTQIATLVKPFTADEPFAVLENVNSPKVVLNKNWNALYFSRSIIPFQRNALYLKSNVRFLNRLGSELALKLIRSSQNFVSASLYSGEERLCAYILQTSHNGIFSDILTDTACSVGMSYRHMFRLLNRLCEDGVLEKWENGYRILDRESLAEKATEFL